jgi:hypothetical protein
VEEITLGAGDEIEEVAGGAIGMGEVGDSTSKDRMLGV